MLEKCSLLLDFGASRIKSAIFKNNEIFDVQSYDSINPCITENKKFEVNPKEIKNKFLEIVENYAKLYEITCIYICSEMHGFLLVDNNNQPISNYISWKDERCTISNQDGISAFEILKNKLGNSFFEKTGMKPRACYPIFNIFQMILNNEITSAKVISLPEWICICGGKSLNKANITMSAGLGFYNIFDKAIDDDLINEVCLGKVKLKFNEVSSNIEVGGYITINNKDVAIFTGIGDHQCAVFGSDNNETSISVNLGTGSQVAIINLENNKCEKRPFLNNSLLSVITHIPSGRALNEFLNFLYEINPNQNFWDKLQKISLDEIKNSTLKIDMAIFESAWNFSEYGFISNIKEGTFNLNNYLASLLKSYINQYKIAIDLLNPPNKFNKIILSGGIPSKVKVIKEYLEILTKLDVKLIESKYDETLIGLKKIAQQNK